VLGTSFRLTLCRRPKEELTEVETLMARNTIAIDLFKRQDLTLHVGRGVEVPPNSTLNVSPLTRSWSNLSRPWLHRAVTRARARLSGQVSAYSRNSEGGELQSGAATGRTPADAHHEAAGKP